MIATAHFQCVVPCTVYSPVGSHKSKRKTIKLELKEHANNFIDTLGVDQWTSFGV